MRKEDAFECFLYLIVTHKSTKPCLPIGFWTKHNINDVSFNMPSNQPVKLLAGETKNSLV